jgi:hypothetical protein
MDGKVGSDGLQPYPYLVGAKYDPTMPINVVWEVLSDLGPVNLRAAAANEVRRKRKLPGLVADAATEVRAAPAKGALGSLPADGYEVTKRWADGRPWVVMFKRDVEVAGIPCRGEAAFGRKGDLISATLSREWLFGTRRFAASSSFRFHSGHQDGRLADVKLGADQEIDGLPCLGGTLAWFHLNQRISSLNLASDRDIDGIPCAGGESVLVAVHFHRNGRLAGATLAREHELIGRTFPRRTRISLDEKGRLVSAALGQDWDIDGIPAKAGVQSLTFHDNGRVAELVLARSHPVLGQRYDGGTFLRFDRDGHVIYVRP